jgi:N,N-dimethylformamidase
MLPLAAYADRLSVRPHETIRFHAANATGQAVDAKIVRVICADANPAGPGIVLEDVSVSPVQLLEPTAQKVPHGSYAVCANVGSKLSGNSLTLACRVFPTYVNGREQVIASCAHAQTKMAVELLIDESGHLCARADNGVTRIESQATRVLAQRHWSYVWLSFDAETGTLSVGGNRLNEIHAPPLVATTAFTAPTQLVLSQAPLMFAAANPADPERHFNGKIENPSLWLRSLSDTELAAVANNDAHCLNDALARWNFSHEPQGRVIHDEGANALHGEVVNTPGRAMTSSRWDGREMHFAHAPDQYAAIHFHEDDLDDCRWPASYEWTVPPDTRSAVYALILNAGEVQENVPFHVVPTRGKSTARIAVLASTLTYTIYGNHARQEYDTNSEWRRDWQEQVAAWGCYPHNPGDHREYGLSTYNTHTDGSGISIASWRRPMLNVRIGYLTYCHENIRGSGLRHFPADSHLSAWLEQQDLAYDIITDWELHHEGQELLDHYGVVLTGSHPEYHTRAMIDALKNYRDAGGRLCYLGGNGFYWKIAKSPDMDGVIEIRRGEGGIRAWAADPGEYYNQFDGEYGGLWRRNGRAPQHLTGVGFTAQGNFHGSYYRRTAAAADPRVAWMFAGVDAEIIGNHGLSAHGAAGFELDRTDKRLGTPEHALVVASSEDHPADAPWILVPEEVLTHIATWPGESPESLIRADMTFFETPHGGAVFSTGSITFCGSLLTNDGDNETSKIVRNVVERFRDPSPFTLPEN